MRRFPRLRTRLLLSLVVLAFSLAGGGCGGSAAGEIDDAAKAGRGAIDDASDNREYPIVDAASEVAEELGPEIIEDQFDGAADNSSPEIDFCSLNPDLTICQ